MKGALSMNATGYYPTPMPVRPVGPVAPAAYQVASQPRGGGVVDALSNGDMIDKGHALAHLWNMGKTGIDGGRAVNPEFGALFKAAKNLRGNAIFSSLKGIVGATIPFMTRSALFEAAISAVANGVRLFQGRIGFGEFAGRVTADSMTGLAGGAGAAVGGAVVLALLPFTGAMATIFAAIGGVAGYSIVAGMVRNSSIYNTVVGTVRRAFGGY
jgi:hypothetical protein